MLAESAAGTGAGHGPDRARPKCPADNPFYAHFFGDDETARLFSESAQVRAILLLDGALAKVQGELGVILAESVAFLYCASFKVQIDPSALAAETAVNAVLVPALVAAFRTLPTTLRIMPPMPIGQ